MGVGGKGRLTRSLALRHVFALSTGAMLSSGLFLLPGLAAAKAGPAAIVAYLISVDQTSRPLHCPRPHQVLLG